MAIIQLHKNNNKEISLRNHVSMDHRTAIIFLRHFFNEIYAIRQCRLPRNLINSKMLMGFVQIISIRSLNFWYEYELSHILSSQKPKDLKDLEIQKLYEILSTSFNIIRPSITNGSDAKRKRETHGTEEGITRRNLTENEVEENQEEINDSSTPTMTTTQLVRTMIERKIDVLSLPNRRDDRFFDKEKCDTMSYESDDVIRNGVPSQKKITSNEKDRQSSVGIVTTTNLFDKSSIHQCSSTTQNGNAPPSSSSKSNDSKILKPIKQQNQFKNKFNSKKNSNEKDMKNKQSSTNSSVASGLMTRNSKSLIAYDSDDFHEADAHIDDHPYHHHNRHGIIKFVRGFNGFQRLFHHNDHHNHHNHHNHHHQQQQHGPQSQHPCNHHQNNNSNNQTTHNPLPPPQQQQQQQQQHLEKSIGSNSNNQSLKQHQHQQQHHQSVEVNSKTLDDHHNKMMTNQTNNHHGGITSMINKIVSYHHQHHPHLPNISHNKSNKSLKIDDVKRSSLAHFDNNHLRHQGKSSVISCSNHNYHHNHHLEFKFRSKEAKQKFFENFHFIPATTSVLSMSSASDNLPSNNSTTTTALSTHYIATTKPNFNTSNSMVGNYHLDSSNDSFNSTTITTNTTSTTTSTTHPMELTATSSSVHDNLMMTNSSHQQQITKVESKSEKSNNISTFSQKCESVTAFPHASNSMENIDDLKVAIKKTLSQFIKVDENGIGDEKKPLKDDQKMKKNNGKTKNYEHHGNLHEISINSDYSQFKHSKIQSSSSSTSILHKNGHGLLRNLSQLMKKPLHRNPQTTSHNVQKNSHSHHQQQQPQQQPLPYKRLQETNERKYAESNVNLEELKQKSLNKKNHPDSFVSLSSMRSQEIERQKSTVRMHLLGVVLDHLVKGGMLVINDYEEVDDNILDSQLSSNIKLLNSNDEERQHYGHHFELDNQTPISSKNTICRTPTTLDKTPPSESGSVRKEKDEIEDDDDDDDDVVDDDDVKKGLFLKNGQLTSQQSFHFRDLFNNHEDMASFSTYMMHVFHQHNQNNHDSGHDDNGMTNGLHENQKLKKKKKRIDKLTKTYHHHQQQQQQQQSFKDSKIEEEDDEDNLLIDLNSTTFHILKAIDNWSNEWINSFSSSNKNSTPTPSPHNGTIIEAKEILRSNDSALYDDSSLLNDDNSLDQQQKKQKNIKDSDQPIQHSPSLYVVKEIDELNINTSSSPTQPSSKFKNSPVKIISPNSMPSETVVKSKISPNIIPISNDKQLSSDETTEVIRDGSQLLHTPAFTPNSEVDSAVDVNDVHPGDATLLMNQLDDGTSEQHQKYLQVAKEKMIMGTIPILQNTSPIEEQTEIIVKSSIDDKIYSASPSKMITSVAVTSTTPIEEMDKLNIQTSPVMSTNTIKFSPNYDPKNSSKSSPVVDGENTAKFYINSDDDDEDNILSPSSAVSVPVTEQNKDEENEIIFETKPEKDNHPKFPKLVYPSSYELTVETGQKLPPKQNNYKKLRRIGKGAFGEVYMAKRTSISDNQIYIIKSFARKRVATQGWFDYRQSQYANKEEKESVHQVINERKKHFNKKMFHEVDSDNYYATIDFRATKEPLEIAVLRRLHNENIVKMIDLIETKEGYDIVMVRHGDGMDLFEFIERGPKITESLAAYIFHQLAMALLYMHLKVNIVHRDIKDENIIVNRNFQVKLIDFGSASFIPPPSGISMQTRQHPTFPENLTKHSRIDFHCCFHSFCGTAEYCSPEVLQGRKYDGTKLDIWSLGVTLYTLIFGQNPFASAKEVVNARLKYPKDAREPSVDLKRLLFLMLRPEPHLRLNVVQLLKESWMQQTIDRKKFSWKSIMPSKFHDYDDRMLKKNGI